MKTVLVTAGGTTEPVDPVRVLGNLSTGFTGMEIARKADLAGWKSIALLAENSPVPGPWPFPVFRFKSHADLQALMKDQIERTRPEAIIHSAAVSDYGVEGTYLGNPDIGFIPAGKGNDSKSEKISSGQKDLWIRLKPLPKILNMIRNQWHYQGILVSFKLEEGGDLLKRALDNLIASGSDLVVANSWSDHKTQATLVTHHAFSPKHPSSPIPLADGFACQIARPHLADCLIDFLDRRLSHKSQE